MSDDRHPMTAAEMRAELEHADRMRRRRQTRFALFWVGLVPVALVAVVGILLFVRFFLTR